MVAFPHVMYTHIKYKLWGMSSQLQVNCVCIYICIRGSFQKFWTLYVFSLKWIYRETHTHKRELLKNPTKIEEIQQKKFIGRNWTTTTCLLRDSNPDYQCLKITSCRCRLPPRMHSFNLTLLFPTARCNISAVLSCRFLFQSRSSLFKVFNQSRYLMFRGNLTMTP